MMPMTSQPSLKSEREKLALDALHQLTAQFAVNPDFTLLMRLLLLTLSGQFGVPGAVAVVHQPGTRQGDAIYHAVGSFDRPPEERACPEKYQCWNCLKNSSAPCAVPPFGRAKGIKYSGTCLRDDFELSAVVPLVQKQTLIGFIGLGHKHTGESLGGDEIALLQTIVETVSPLILNSFLITDIGATKIWYESLLDSVPQAIFVCDAAGRLKMLNRAAGAIIDDPNRPKTDNEIVMPPITDLLAKLDLPESIRKALISGSPLPSGGSTIVNRQSGRIYNISMSRVMNGTNGLYDSILLLEDVTTAKEAESHLFDMQRLAERGAMVASIAHEIRNVLAAVHGGIELSLIALKREEVVKVEDYLGRVLDGVRHLGRFASELMETGKVQFETELTSLNDLIANVIIFLKVQRRFKTIKLVTELDATIPKIEIDSDQISQLLLNFLNNSADAIKEASRREGTITIRTAAVEGGVTLTVIDNGCGILPENRGKLFQSKFTTKKEGHGYGLVTCSRIIANHHACLKIDSVPGEYTSISITFPTVCDPASSV